MNRESCATGTKILSSVGIPLLGHLRHRAMHLVLQTGKAWGKVPLRPNVNSQYHHANAAMPVAKTPNTNADGVIFIQAFHLVRFDVRSFSCAGRA